MGTNYVSNGVTGETRAGNTTNNVTIGPDGLTLFGTAKKKNKITVSSVSFEGGATAPSLTLINNIAYVWSYKKNSDEDVWYSFKLPNDYEEGTDVSVFIEWAPSLNAPGDVKWDINYNLIADAGSIDQAFSILTTTQSSTVGQNQKITTPALTIPGTGLTKDFLIQLKAIRNGSALADTLNGDAYLCMVTIEYTINKLGSN